MMDGVNRSQRGSWLLASGGVIFRVGSCQSHSLSVRAIYAVRKKQRFLNESTIGV